jgi:hypothetical protein
MRHARSTEQDTYILNQSNDNASEKWILLCWQKVSQYK